MELVLETGLRLGLKTGLGDENHPDCRTIRSLENRLDKVMIKHNEGLRIKKTYEVILQRLKDERKGYESQLGLIE